ncbi:hypothetical protein DPMN_063489 [Dreissena polymorpha]|uniref:Uncharacterized protein n=1 Tax=Dreissena polymorpha TaxID=45954 RepID=A0A9D4HK73_DREPO|nr:hypothetical protein DPMN_063489 [Dreissena polymorpha]
MGITMIQDNPEDDFPLAFLCVSRDLFDEDIRDLTAVDKDLAICETNITDWERPATKLIEKLKPTQPDADIDEKKTLHFPHPAPSVIRASLLITLRTLLWQRTTR